MNEELLKAIYDNEGFEARGVSFDEFKQDIRSPELQRTIYDKAGFEGRGVSFEEFQGDLGATQAPVVRDFEQEAQPAPQPVAQEIPDLNIEGGVSDDIAIYNLDNDQFAQEVQRRQKETDEATKRGEGPGWWKRRAGGAYRFLGNTLTDFQAVTAAALDKVGAEGAAENVRGRMQENQRMIALSNAGVPTNIKQSAFEKRLKNVDYEGEKIDVEVDDEGNFVQARDQKGFVKEVSPEFVEDFNEEGLGDFATRDILPDDFTDVRSLAQTAEQTMYDLGAMIFATKGAGAAAKGASSAAMKATAGRTVAGVAFVQSYGDNYAQALEDFDGDVDKAANVAAAKSAATAALTYIFPKTVETGGAVFNKAQKAIDVAIKTGKGSPLTAGVNAVLGEVVEENLDVVASNLIDISQGIDKKVLSTQEFLTTTAISAFTSAPSSIMAGRNETKANIVNEGILEAASSEEGFNHFMDVMAESDQDPALRDQKIELVSAVKESLDALPEGTSLKKKRRIATNIINKSRKQNLITDKTDPVVKQEIQEEISNLDEDTENVLSEPEVVEETTETLEEDAQETGPLREEGVPQEREPERVGDLQGEPQAQEVTPEEVVQETEEVTPPIDETPTTTVPEQDVTQVNEAVDADIETGDLKVYRGVRDNAPANTGFLWVTEDQNVASEYATSEYQGDGEGRVVEMNIKQPTNSLEMPYGVDTEVRGQDIASLLDNIITDQVESGKLTPEQGVELMEGKIDEFKKLAGEDLGKWHEKINKPETSALFGDIVRDLGYDSLKVYEGANKTKPTYGLLRKQAPTQEAPLEAAPVEPPLSEETPLAEPAPPTTGQQQATVEREMSDEAERMVMAVNNAITNLQKGKTGGALTRFDNSNDKNKFIQAVDNIAGDNPKQRAKALHDVITSGGRLPKAIKAEVERLLGESIPSFVLRVRNLHKRREALTRRAVAERQAKRVAAAQGNDPAIQDAENASNQGQPTDPTYKDDVGIDDVEMDGDGLIGLKTADVNEIREYFDMEATKAKPKTVNALINEARKFISTGQENFMREAKVVHEVLFGNPLYDLDAKMIAVRRAIDHMENSLKDAEKRLENTSKPFEKFEIQNQIDIIKRDLHSFTLAYNKIGTVAGRILRFRQERLKSDYYTKENLERLMIQAKGLNALGDPIPLTTTEENFIERKSEELTTLREEIDHLHREVNNRSETLLETLAKKEVENLQHKYRPRKVRGRRKSKYTVKDAAAKLRNTLNNGPCR